MSPVSSLRRLTVLVAVAAALPAGARAQASAISTLFGTGVAANGTVLANGSTDSHYATYAWTTLGTLGASLGQAQTLNNGYQPTAVGQTYAYSPTTRWIWNNAAGDLGANPSFRTVFRTTFDLTGFTASSASINGMFAGDNAINAVYLNGHLVGSVSTSTFDVFTGFALTSGFVAGVNTLDFYASDAGAPGGLDIAMSGTAVRSTAITTPEPAGVALIGAGLAGVAVVARRRTRQA